jgi:hypothetical protein
MRLLISLALATVFFSCNTGNSTPDVSNIEIKLNTRRFDKELFSLDSNKLDQHLDSLIAKYPSFGEIFLTTILGADPKWNADSTAIYVKNGFISPYRQIYDSSEIIFSNFSPYENEIKKGLQFLKYYFPSYKSPKNIITYIGPLDGYGDILTEDALIVGLQFYLGKNAFCYQSSIIQGIYPTYITNRFEPDYIAINSMKNIILDMYPEKKEEATLAVKMIENGKRMYCLQKLLPEKKAFQLIGYTETQLKDCYSHEANIWNFFIQNGLLQIIENNTIKNYIGDSPTTQELGAASPGNIGTFTGWQIVKKYMDNNPKVSVLSLMGTNAEIILEKAKYKP